MGQTLSNYLLVGSLITGAAELPGLVSATRGLLFGASLRGFTAAESAAILEARAILSSSQLATLRAAHVAGIEAEVAIAGRTIVYVPGYTGSGMTLFGESGFILGKHAFSSTGELGRTLLQELYRLGHSLSARGVSQAVVTEETAAAAGFAERAAAFLGL